MNKKTLSILSLALMAGALTGCSKGLDVKESMTIEYGKAISTDVATYLSDEVTGEERTKVLAEAKVVLENDEKAGKDYQLPGDYTVYIKYNGDITEVKVTVKDTKKPVFKDLTKELEYVRDCKPTAEVLAKQFNAEDLDEVTITVDDSQVDYTKEGNYKAVVKAVDSSKNEEVQEITIKVVKPTLKLDKSSKSMYEKESFVLKATVKGKDTKAKFSSSNTSVATVSETGKVTAKKKGTVTITAEANGVKTTCKVTVKSVPKGSSTTTQIVTNTNTGKKENVSTVKPKPEKPKPTKPSGGGSSSSGSSNLPSKPSSSEPYVAYLNAAKRYNKIMVVSASSSSTSKGTFEYFTKTNGRWTKEFSTAAQLGSRGINKVKEGDRKTPTGLFTFTHVMGIASNPGTKMPYHKIDGNDYWCGGRNHYNQFIDEDKQSHNCDKSNDERLIKYKTPYQYLAALNYNSSNTYGKGSAIFLHCNGNSGVTAGCVGISKSYMKRVIKEIDSSTCIIIDLKKNISKY